MFNKIKQWFIDRKMNKAAVKDALKKKKNLLDFVSKMKELYNFVTWINKNIGNRAARKAFWKRIMNGEDLVEKQLQRLLKLYQENLTKIDEFVDEKKK